MSKKIGLVYLDVSNLGDVIIYETANTIVHNIIESNGIVNCETVPISIGTYRCRVESRKKSFILNFLERSYAAVFRKITQTNIIRKKIIPVIQKKFLDFLWTKTDTWRYYKKNELPKLETCDLLIFCGGGLIKFHKQNFYLFLDHILEYSDKHHIPVLMNAQGIEGYDENDFRSEILKKAINRNCVKYISTRDDYEMLKNCYIENPEIDIRRVCDPAFWLKETYGVERYHCDTKCVGINVIRANIFGEYTQKISKEELGSLYYGLIKRLHEDGYRVELFSNGVEEDTEFGKWLLKKYPMLEDAYGVKVVYTLSTKEFVEMLAKYDRFLSVRLHASIVGCMLGIPNVGLVWNRKQLLFGKQIGLEKNYITRDEFNSDYIYQMLMNAKPYVMDENYKRTVYDELELQMLKWL